MNDSTTTVYAAVVDAAPPPRTPMPLKRDASPTEDAPQATTTEDAVAAQEEADTAALTSHYAEDAIAADRDRNAEAAARDRERGVDHDRSAGAAPTNAETKRQTWLDLLPDGAPRPPLDSMLTREELLEELHRRGVEVTSVTLVFWEKSGVLPRAVRRYRGGRAHTLYPRFAVDAIAQVRDRQAAGRTLEEIAPLVRAWAASAVTWRDPLAQPLASARAGVAPLARAYGAAAARVVLLDEDGAEVGAHEFPVPAD